MALSTSSNAQGSQGSTQTPQTSAAAGAGSPTAAPAGSVQPGTAKDLLTSQNGVVLSGNGLTEVQLEGSPGGGQTAAQLEQPAQPVHQVSPAALFIPAALLILAIVVFWAMTRSAKNTTY